MDRCGQGQGSGHAMACKGASDARGGCRACREGRSLRLSCGYALGACPPCTPFRVWGWSYES